MLRTFKRPLQTPPFPHPWSTLATPNNYPRNTQRILLDQPCNTIETYYKLSPWNTFGRSSKLPWNTLETPMEHPWNTLKTPSKYRENYIWLCLTIFDDIWLYLNLSNSLLQFENFLVNQSINQSITRANIEELSLLKIPGIQYIIFMGKVPSRDRK